MQQELPHTAAQIEANIAGVEDEMECLNDDGFYWNEACN
jgi:hypothetical protein